MINLKDLGTLKICEVSERSKLPKMPAIYFLLQRHDKSIYYIGQTMNIWERFKYHKRIKEIEDPESLQILYVAIEKMPELSLTRIERMLIAKHMPPSNIQCKPSEKAPVYLAPNVRFELKRLREIRGLSGWDLAGHLGISSSHYWLVERGGVKKMQADFLNKICVALKCSLDELIRTD